MSGKSLLQLAATLRGTATDPDDDAYEAARRVWNGTIDKRPAVVVHCEGTDDVTAALAYARQNDLSVSVRSAGHHVAGSSVLDGGMVVDVSRMNAVEVDADARRVRVAGGATLGDVDATTQPHGLAVPLGVVSETGVAGLTLAGGYGWMRRKHGLSCDNVVSVDVVLADGQLLHVDAHEHPALFWALRGGGWDLGVVTALEFDAHPVGPDVHLPFLTFPLEEGVDVLLNLRDFAQGAPHEFGAIALCWTFPHAEPFDEALWGRPFVGVAGPWIGDPAEGERACAPLRDLGTVLTDLSATVPWVAAQRFFDEDYPRGRRYHWKSAHLTDLDEDAAAVLVDRAGSRPSPLTSLDIWINGGAIAHIADDATPITNRSAHFMIGIEANWDDPADDAANQSWSRGTADALAPYARTGTYLNFDDLTDPHAVRHAAGANYERLAAIKRRYDPANLFRSRGALAR